MANNDMANYDWLIPGVGAVTNLIGASSANKSAKEANRQAEQERGKQQDWMARMWGYQEPLAQTAAGINAGMQPIYNQQIGLTGWAYGMEPGSQIPIPTQENTAIPAHLRPYANAQPGTWQNDLFKWAMVNNATPYQIEDTIKDIQNGENPISRFQRAGWSAPPEDYQSPSLTTGGGAITVPGSTTGVAGATGGLQGIPSWMQVPDVDEIMQKLQNASDVDIQQMRTQLQGITAQNLGSRGFTNPSMGSTTQAGTQANVPLWMQQQQTQQNANLAGLGYNMNMQNKNYMQNVANSLQNNLLQAQAQNQGMIDTSAYANAAANQANIYNQQAQGYGQQAGQYASNVGKIVGNWWPDYMQRQQAANAPVGGQGTQNQQLQQPGGLTGAYSSQGYGSSPVQPVNQNPQSGVMPWMNNTMWPLNR